MPSNICLCGWKGSGKSRAAKILATHGWEVKKFATPLKRIVKNSFGLATIEDCKEQPIIWPDGVDITSENNTLLEELAKKIVKNILLEIGLTDWAASTRVDDVSVLYTPVTGLDGQTPHSMMTDVLNMLYGFDEKTTYRHLLQQLGTDVMRKWSKDIHVKMMEKELKDCKKNWVVDDVRFPNELKLVEKYGAETVWLHRPAQVPTDFHESEVSLSMEDCEYSIISREGELLDESVENRAIHGMWDIDVIIPERY